MMLSVQFSRAQDRGVIFIGNSSTDLATEYTYTYTQRNIPQSVPIFAAVFSNGNPSITVAKTEDITISCTPLENGAGFTRLLINDITLLAADDTSSIFFEPLEDGRTVSVQCVAISNSGTCPISTGGAQFCPDTSQSNVVSVKVLPPATVTHCKLARFVINGDSTFAVQLSEPALTDVTVSCTVDAVSTLGMTISSLSLPAGSTGGEVSYNIPSGSAGASAQVTCTALSATGSQYTTATSQVDASTAVFTWRAITLSFEPSNVKVYNTTVTSFLVLSDASVVNVACRAYTESSLQTALQASTPNCQEIDSQSSAETMPWRVESAFFEMKADSGAAADIRYFKPVITSRIQPVSQAVSEVVLTRCCVRDNSVDVRFRGLHATMITVAELAPFVCEQCNTTVEDPKAERILQNPGYVEVAPCPCNLIENDCDFNCCCDEECSANEKARFSECLPGLPGGEPAEAEEYRCSSSAFNLPDWHLVTCVFYENNAYLGMYYMNRARIVETSFTEVVSQEYKGRFSFSKPERLFESPIIAYSHGVSLTTLRGDVAVGPRSSGILALPRPGTGGTCDFFSPVKFLVAEQASCTSSLLPDTCSSLSHFSGRIYAVSSEIGGCSQSFKVTSTLRGNNVVPTDVRYYCATDLSPYLAPTGTALNALPQNQVSQFGSGLVNENCSTPCSSQLCLDYNIGRASTATEALPNLCSWDDGTTAPRIPLLTSGVCSNVVLDVRYKFEWSGSQITRLTASVILGDISNVAQGSGVPLTQRFETEWVHKTNGSVYSLSDNFDSTTEAYHRSGSSGYNDGAPLFSGCAVYNETTGEFQGVATNSERQMAVWRPGVDGLCENARRQSLTFADDTFSSCALQLTVNELDSGCEDLRQTIFNHLNVLMPSGVVGRFGYNNEQDLTMWIPVVREVLNQTEESSVPAVPNGTEPFKTWADSITGVCRVPSAINLNIMYSQTGAVNGYPRHEVVGAYISYSQATWNMDCQGAQAARCDATSGITQNFFLTSSVQYTKVDTTSQNSKTRFHTRCDPYDFASSSSCERFFSNVYREECYWETCWQELAYPVRPSADRGPEYNWRLQALPVFLALVLGILGYVSVAKPGWS
ncbi:hypothetical protein RRG08_045476 [Elysia crispata]|uniref:Tectonic domain-containing protein n=1 Tax=Elysia crispata TaxID=231223 RepID=A0AAE1DX02_9GAST|nr:hypothetical protein RRG08_045476 [Elysia crispata]